MDKKSIKKTISSIILLFIVYNLWFISPVFANGILPACVKTGDCGLNDFLVLGVKISELIFKFVGVLAFVFFVVGGIIWLTSAGNPERVGKGKMILINSLIGLLIVFFAWHLINLIVCAFSAGQVSETCQIFDQRPWSNFPAAK